MAPATFRSRGRPCQASVGGEALGSAQALCPTIEECQGGEVGGSGREHPHGGRE